MTQGFDTPISGIQSSLPKVAAIRDVNTADGGGLMFHRIKYAQTPKRLHRVPGQGQGAIPRGRQRPLRISLSLDDRDLEGCSPKRESQATTDQPAANDDEIKIGRHRKAAIRFSMSCACLGRSRVKTS